MSTEDWIVFAVAMSFLAICVAAGAIYIVSSVKAINRSYKQKDDLEVMYRSWINSIGDSAETAEPLTAIALKSAVDDPSITICECGTLIKASMFDIHAEICPIAF